MLFCKFYGGMDARYDKKKCGTRQKWTERTDNIDENDYGERDRSRARQRLKGSDGFGGTVLEKKSLSSNAQLRQFTICHLGIQHHIGLESQRQLSTVGCVRICGSQSCLSCVRRSHVISCICRCARNRFLPHRLGKPEPDATVANRHQRYICRLVINPHRLRKPEPDATVANRRQRTWQRTRAGCHRLENDRRITASGQQGNNFFAFSAVINQLASGHSSLHFHLFKAKRRLDPCCPHCAGKETSTHLFNFCPKYKDSRQSLRRQTAKKKHTQ
ncbi:hypothetical protein VP01_661g1 [Puccinia sorghi]|uniref:Uncharacterized protein n=1 Tax=Puccinia sorghi TaxID=27349 RepID=A0A0L6UF79_9BASI|nr:hypothetical protein VP01_661g1 [Puccinia sorghi]